MFHFVSAMLLSALRADDDDSGDNNFRDIDDDDVVLTTTSSLCAEQHMSSESCVKRFIDLFDLFDLLICWSTGGSRLS